MNWNSADDAPKDGKCLLLKVSMPYHTSRAVIGMYVNKFEWESEDDDEGDTDPETGLNYAPEGWYERCLYSDRYAAFPITDPIAGWMPIPDA